MVDYLANMNAYWKALTGGGVGYPIGAKTSHLGVGRAQTLALALGGRGHDQTDDQSVQAQGLGEDEDQDHADEESGLLGVGADAGVTDDADGEACCQGGHADSQTGTQVGVAGVLGVGGCLHLSVDDHSRDEAVDAQHTSHDNGNDRSHHHVRAHDAHGGDADAGLSRAVGGAQVREDDGRGHAHEAEEGGGRLARLHPG
mmetsp:Transcript_4463/g.10595  ORF Transcript_4463/g.10595 Transcript_4463/m.10595 type:complete len:200 (+) Transcript_4463:87-686(+)